MQAQGNRRTPEDHEKLLEALGEADRDLRAGDPRAAAEALKRAGVRAAAMWGGIGVPVLPRPARDLITLTGDVQTLPARDGFPGSAAPLLERLDEIRSAFEGAAEKDNAV